MRALLARADTIRGELLDLVERDAEAYQAVVDAQARPKEPPAQAAEREAAVQRALAGAVRVPLRAAVLAADVLALCEPIAERGNQRLISDVGVAALMADAALQAAGMNVRVNLADLQGRGARVGEPGRAGAADRLGERGPPARDGAGQPSAGLTAALIDGRAIAAELRGELRDAGRAAGGRARHRADGRGRLGRLRRRLRALHAPDQARLRAPRVRGPRVPALGVDPRGRARRAAAGPRPRRGRPRRARPDAAAAPRRPRARLARDPGREGRRLRPPDQRRLPVRQRRPLLRAGDAARRHRAARALRRLAARQARGRGRAQRQRRQADGADAAAPPRDGHDLPHPHRAAERGRRRGRDPGRGGRPGEPDRGAPGCARARS